MAHGTGVYVIEHRNAQGDLIECFEVQNGWTTQGANYMFDVAFNSATALNPWYIGLIDGSVAATLAITDTISSKGWTELTSYDETNRLTWNSGAAANAEIVNTSPIVFTFSTTATVYGIFCISHNVKGNTTAGTLFSTAALATPRLVNSGDTLTVTSYTLKITL